MAAKTTVMVQGTVIRQEWAGEAVVNVTVQLTALAGNDFAAIVAGRALKGDSVVLVGVTGGDDAADVDALVNP